MINLKDITKKFSDKVILNNINLNICDNDCVAIIGQSGVGKSVLLKHINGLLKPDSGQVFIDDVNVNKLNFYEKQKYLKKMSMVFQFGALFDSLSVKNNIMLALNHITNLNDGKKMEKVSEVLDLVNLSNVENLFPSDLSGGMRKRVGIARAIATNPEYILYDEPTTGLDPITTDKVCRLIKNISTRKKQTTIVVTHEMKIVHEIVNKVVMIYQGDIIFQGSPEDLKLSNDKYIKYFISGKK